MSVEVLLIGLSLGVSYAFFALGYSLVYSVLGLMNLAHGDVLVLGAFASFGLWTAGAAPAVAIIGGVLAAAVAGAIVEETVYRPLRFAADAVLPLVAGLGAALIIRNAITATTDGGSNFPALFPEAGITLEGVTLSFAALVALAGAVLLAFGLERFLRTTRYGWTVQAVAQDITAARLIGIPVWAVVLGIYAIAGAVGALGGILYASIIGTLKVSLGFAATVQAFTAAIIGGITSLRGAVLGGLVLGVVHSFVAYNLPGTYRDAITFLLLIVVLLFLPGGLVGSRDEREVRA